MNVTTPEDLDQTSADLYATAELIERNGWSQGTNWRDNGGKLPSDCPVCVLGGLNVVTHGFPWNPIESDAMMRRDRAALAVARYVERATGFALADVYEAAHWNDEAGRTAEEVCAVLRACADKLTETVAG